ncbi:amidohydrolase [Polaromonas sp.]|uniref:amidohydrolase family protein n=1 Tax=Polaromonas sp. TaxID=1869339 RepID=UPI0035633A53
MRQDLGLENYPGACDCHVHIYEDGYPTVPDVAWVPRHSPVSLYRSQVQKPLGIERAVLIQPTAYGFDNSCMIDALRQFEGAARGVALLAPDVPDGDIVRLHEHGVRAVRYMLIGGVLDWSSLEPMAARMRDHGWMINLQFDGRVTPEHEQILKRLPCRLVIDHTGKFLEPVAPDHPSFQSLLRVLDTGRAWIKLSAPYETSKTGGPRYDDVSLLARTLVERFPERCLWATNWPHPSQDPIPMDADLYALLFSWATSSDARRRILVDNPAHVYGYSLGQ